MAGLKAGLKAVLKQLKVRIDNPDDDTMLLRNVPADSRCFSKPQTNVLVKRPRAGLPFLVCVDEDLDYVGPDREMARTFAVASCQQGWRVVSMGGVVYDRAEDAVRQALAMLGVSRDAAAPAITRVPSVGADLLIRFAVDVTARVHADLAPPSSARGEAAEHAATSVLSWRHRFPVIVGASGLGKTNLLYKVAGLCAHVRPEWRFLSLDLSCLLTGTLWEGEREKVLSLVLEEAARSPVVVALERLEVAMMTVPLTPWMLAGALDCGARLAATCEHPFAERLAEGPLARHVDLIEISELAREDATAVLGHLRETLAAHHRVAIDAPVAEAAVERSLTLAGRLPDKAITLLDAAAARAALMKQATVALCDVYLVASRMKDL